MVQKKIHTEWVLMNSINLKSIRKNAGFSQQELANLLGIKQQQYSRYETKANQISLGIFLKILTVCNLEIKIETKK